jgi:hypothetical protein
VYASYVLSVWLALGGLNASRQCHCRNSPALRIPGIHSVIAHEGRSLGVFLYCVVHCCKVYALAHHPGIPIIRVKSNLYPLPVYVPRHQDSTSDPQVVVAFPRISLSLCKT